MRMISCSLGAFVLIGLLATGCGDTDDDSEIDGNQGRGASSSGGSLNLDPNNGLGATGNGNVIDPNSACAKGTASANLAGVNMFVMFDRSSSMNERAQRNGPTRWQLTSTALSSFFASPEAAGLKLALRFFPHDVPLVGCNQDACETSACAAPLVALGALTSEVAPADAQEQLLLDATTASAPGMSGQGTPISAALSGAYQWASAQHTKTPGENTVVVLVTDGEPNGCVTDIDDISGLAAAALATDGTRTYAIGLTGSRTGDMNQIAMAGGTAEGIFVADGANTTQDLVNALADIRGAILDCDFAMPVPKPGIAVEPSFVNVNFTPGGGQTSTLLQVANEASCAATPGWYYDNPANPNRIILCKSACDTVTADPMASLEILLGCPTSTEVPR